MNNTELVNKIKSIKTTKDKKIMYSYAVYIINHLPEIKKDLHKLQLRTNSLVYNNKGYFKKYNIDNPEKTKRNNKSNNKRNKSNSVLLKKQKQLQTKMRSVWKSYNEGELSKKSTKILDGKTQ